MMQAPAVQNFVDAFDDSTGGCVRDCACGRVFYNPDDTWSWEAGELEKLRADAKATPLDYSVSTFTFEGTAYVIDCDCWHDRALRVIAWLQNNDQAIAAFLNAEKKRKQAEADRAPAVAL